jgi:hypothetical protein
MRLRLRLSRIISDIVSTTTILTAMAIAIADANARHDAQCRAEDRPHLPGRLQSLLP